MKHLLLLTLFSFQLFAQDASYFKVFPKLNGTEPEWVTEMYSSVPNIDKVTNLYLKYYESHSFEKNIHTQNYKYWIRNVYLMADEKGFIYPDSRKKHLNYLKKGTEKKALRKKNKQLNLKGSLSKKSGTSTTQWTSLGPTNTYKKGSLKTRPTQVNVYSLGIAPSNPDIMYAATEGAGIFKTTDRGLNWQLVGKDSPILRASDIKVHPENPNTLYLLDSGRVYESTNAGEGWTELLYLGGAVEQLHIYETDPNIMFLAAKKGLYKTVDGGVNWTTVMTNRCWDIVSHPTNPDILYVAAHNPTLVRAEVFKSEDVGHTWTLKDTNWYVPEDMANASDGGCKLAVTPADPNRIYACLIGASKEGDSGWIRILEKEKAPLHFKSTMVAVLK